MKKCNKWIRFEVETRATPFGMFGGGVAAPSNTTADNRPASEGAYTNNRETDEEGYAEMTEDDVRMMQQILGGS